MVHSILSIIRQRLAFATTILTRRDLEWPFLKWVYFTDSSLDSITFLHALAMDPALVSKSPGILDKNHLRPEKAITMFCVSLVMIESRSHLVHFRHDTTQQHFQSQPEMFPNTKFEIDKSALRYLQLVARNPHGLTCAGLHRSQAVSAWRPKNMPEETSKHIGSHKHL